MVPPLQPEVLDIEVSDALRERWQSTLTLLGELLNVPSSLVMRVHSAEIEVFARSQNAGNIYREGEKASLNTGLYCETVMATRNELAVPDARQDPAWDHNPDIKQGMVSYLGLPLEWPSGHLFGTICVLDRVEHRHSNLHRRVLSQFHDVIENDLALVFENHLLRQEIAHRESVETELRATHTELQRLTDRLQLAREQERAVIAHRLHDDIAQALAAAKMDLATCTRKLPSTVRPEVNPVIASVTHTLDGAIARLRVLCDDLIPAMLEDLGLVPTIEWEADEFSRRTGIPCSVDSPRELPNIERRSALLLYRIVQEALARMAEPVPAQRARIVLEQDSANTVLRLSAIGRGEPPETTTEPRLDVIGGLHRELTSRGGTLRMWRSTEGEMVMLVTVPSVAPR